MNRLPPRTIQELKQQRTSKTFPSMWLVLDVYVEDHQRLSFGTYNSHILNQLRASFNLTLFLRIVHCDPKSPEVFHHITGGPTDFQQYMSQLPPVPYLQEWVKSPSKYTSLWARTTTSDPTRKVDEQPPSKRPRL